MIKYEGRVVANTVRKNFSTMNEEIHTTVEFHTGDNNMLSISFPGQYELKRPFSMVLVAEEIDVWKTKEVVQAMDRGADVDEGTYMAGSVSRRKP